MPPRAAPLPPPLAPPSPPPLAPPSPPPADPTGQDLIFPEVFVVALLVFCTLLFLIAECCKNYVRGQRDDRANRNRGYITRGDVEQPRWLRQFVAVATPQLVVAEYRGDERKFDTDECVICLEDFEEGDECGMLEKCGHAYHESCIKEWLSKQRNCPLCRCKVRVEWAVRVAPDSPASSSSSSSSNSW